MAQLSQEMSEKIRKWSESYPKLSGNGPKWPGNVRKWSGNSQKMSENYPKNVQEMSSDGLKLSGYCLKLTNKPKRGKNTSFIPQTRKLAAKKWNGQPFSPFLWFNFFSVFFSFLFVQIFPYGQSDRLFHIEWVTVLYPHLWWSCFYWWLLFINLY